MSAQQDTTGGHTPLQKTRLSFQDNAARIYPGTMEIELISKLFLHPFVHINV